MQGAPARAIQKLAGHQDLAMTPRYRHLRPAAMDAAIRLLDDPAGRLQAGRGVQDFGDMGETAPGTKNGQ